MVFEHAHDFHLSEMRKIDRSIVRISEHDQKSPQKSSLLAIFDMLWFARANHQIKLVEIVTFLNSFSVLERMTINKGDFIEIEFTALLKDNNLVFDTTNAEDAKKAGIFSENITYAPVVVCVGERMVLEGLDDVFIGKDLSSFSVDLLPEKAFGKKDAKLLQLIPRNKFLEQKVNPVVGLQVNIDDVVGIVKTVTGGRVIVDFNHPFSGKIVQYDVQIKRIVTAPEERLCALVKMFLKQKEPQVVMNDKKATIVLPVELPKQIQDELNSRWSKLVGVDEIKFINDKLK